MTHRDRVTAGWWMAALLPAMALLLTTTGCRSSSASGHAERPAPSEVVYPVQAEFGDDLDCVVIRVGRYRVRLLNRSPVALGPVRLWLNQQYVADLPQLAVGDNGTLPLQSFLNEYRQTYPTGSWLYPDRDFPILHAELFDPSTGKRHRLLVELDEHWAG